LDPFREQALVHSGGGRKHAPALHCEHRIGALVQHSPVRAHQADVRLLSIRAPRAPAAERATCHRENGLQPLDVFQARATRGWRIAAVLVAHQCAWPERTCGQPLAHKPPNSDRLAVLFVDVKRLRIELARERDDRLRA